VISLLPARNERQSNISLFLFKELAAKPNELFERLTWKFNRNFRVRFKATFHIAPKAVFNLLGVNFTDRYEHCKHYCITVSTFTRRRFASDGSQQHRWTAVNRKADHGWSTSVRCIVPSWTSNISWTANHIFIKRGWAPSGGSYLHKFQTQSVTLSWDCKCYFCKHLNQNLMQNHALQRFIRSHQRRWLE